MPANTPAKNARGIDRYFLGYFLAILLAFLLIFGALMAAIYMRDHDVIAETEYTRVDLARRVITEDFASVAGDMRHLLHEPFLRRYLARDDEASRLALARELANFVEHRQVYSQARLLDARGQERIRIELHGDVAVSSPDDQLQFKGNRYYFKEAAALREGMMYVSPMDLNVEHGVIEEPYRPMIRFAAPLFDDTGRRRGVLVLNFLARTILNRLDSLMADAHGHIDLLDARGYWLKSGDTRREWGFMLGNDQRFDKTYPRAWQMIRDSGKRQFSIGQHLYTVARVHPLEAMGLIVRDKTDPAALEAMRRQMASYYWYIVSDVSETRMFWKQWREFSETALFAFVFVVLTGIAVARRAAGARREKAAMQRQIALHAKVFEVTCDGIILTDRDAVIMDVNPSFTRMTGYTPEDVIGKTPRILQSGRHDKAFYQSMWQVLLENGYWQGEVWNRRKDGEIYLEWLRISSMKDDVGRVVSYVGVVSDVTVRRMAEEELRKSAHYDGLTGLPNRLLLDDRLEQAIARADRNQARVALLFIDLDRFKPINDTYGHPAGDQVLIELARRMRAVVRESDTVARLGGDEFVVVLADERSMANIDEVAERLMEVFNEPLEYQGRRLIAGASMGIAIYPDHADSPQALLARADAAMYAAKQAGRGGYRYHQP